MWRTLRIALLILLALALPVTAGADVVRVLDDPRDALQARVDLIEQARGEIHALYFLARNDSVTMTSLALLRDARRRGVPSVQLLVDAKFHRIPKAVLAHLRDEGVHVRVYHPLTLRHPSWILRRMHEKVMIVDSRRYVTGGRNLAEAYFGLDRKKNYVDRDVYVEGNSAIEADGHFDNLWSSGEVRDLRVRVSDAEKRDAELLLDRALVDAADSGLVELGTGRDWSDGHNDAVPVRFLHDPVPPHRNQVTTHVEKVLEGAQSSIVIESPYFVPPGSLLRLIEKKLREGVRVRIVTNSLRSTDGIFPQAAFLKYRGRLVRAGADVREYKAPDALHAKTIVVDGRIALVGSYNIDPRSKTLNTEVMCMAEDEETAQDLLKSIGVHVEHAWSIQRRVPRVSRAMTFRAWAARLLILPFVENQL